jgi:hypothetical protein
MTGDSLAELQSARFLGLKNGSFSEACAFGWSGRLDMQNEITHQSRAYGSCGLSWWLAVMFLLVAALPVLANGIVPLIPAVTDADRAPLVLGLTVVIILVEAGLLHWTNRERSYGQWIRVCAVLNVSSSLVGSVYIWATNEAWEMMALGLSDISELFLLTVVTEILLLVRLCRPLKHPAKIWIVRGVAINTVSYGLLLGGQLGVFVAANALGGRTDARRLAEWTDSGILKGNSGYIYAFERSGGSGSFKRFDVARGEWESFPTNAPSINPFIWDVVGDKLACVPGASHQGGEEIHIYRLPEFSLIRVIESQASELKLSHDGARLAAVGNDGEAVARRDASGYFAFGRKGLVSVFDTTSGELLARSKRHALNRGLAWAGDDSAVYLVSLKDESLFELEEDKVTGSTGYWRVFFEGLFAQATYAWDWKKSQVELISNANNPQTIATSKTVWLTGVDGTFQQERKGAPHAVKIAELTSRFALSPNGNCAVVQVPCRQPFRAQQFLTLLRLDSSDRRLIIDTNSVYEFRWAAGNSGIVDSQP